MYRWSFRAWMSLPVLAVFSLFLVSCGGGGGGNGGQGGADLLQLVVQPSFGLRGGTTTLMPFNTTSPSSVALVGPNDFPLAGAGESHYLELQFSEEVSEASILNGGLTVTGSDNLQRSFFLDKAGALDASNAFSDDAAPSLVRIYFQDPANPGVPAPLAADGYRLRLSNLLLMSARGKHFCVAEEGGVCTLPSDSVFHFTINGQNTPTGNAPMGAGPTPALPLPTILAADGEIRLFFDRDVDFTSIVGVNPATGRINVTSQDPFCSVPFPMAQGVTMGSNIDIQYAIPAPYMIPYNYGYIIYMPNPFHDPSEVRIRFVDTATTFGIDDATGAFSANGLPTVQNYALPSAIWNNGLLANGNFAPPRDLSLPQGLPLELPPKLVLQGYPNNGVSSVTVTVFGPGNAGASDSSLGFMAAGDGVLGVTDRARNPLSGDLISQWTIQTGPPLAANPEPPDLNIVANGRVLDGFGTAGNTLNAQIGGVVVGQLFRTTVNIDDLSRLQDVTDVLYGQFLNPINSLLNTPRRANPVLAIALGLDPGIPFPPGALVPEVTLNNPPLPPHTQPWGIRMYVVDALEEQVKIFNSHTFEFLGIVPGIASPRGLAGGGGYMYVSNYDSDTIQRFGILASTPFFHQVVGSAAVGAGPTALEVQRNVEDVVVINSLDNSMSFVDIPTFSERVQLSTGMGPTEALTTPRWNVPGGTFAYQVYVPNIISNTVTIYESDSPLMVQVPNGPEGKIIEEHGGFMGPTHGTWSFTMGPVMGTGAQGILVPNSAGNSVSYLGLTFLNLGPAPGFIGPPPSRVFNVVAEYPGGSLAGGGPTDCAINPTSLIHANVSDSAIAIYPGAGQVVVYGFATSILLGTLQLPGNQIFNSNDR